jgi:hypothetical protein
MYVSRLTFHTHPGQTRQVEQKLRTLQTMVRDVGGVRPRILRNHFASAGAPDIVFEQEVADMETLEKQIYQVTAREDFQQWAKQMSALLAQSPKRTIYHMVD